MTMDCFKMQDSGSSFPKTSAKKDPVKQLMKMKGMNRQHRVIWKFGSDVRAVQKIIHWSWLFNICMRHIMWLSSDSTYLLLWDLKWYDEKKRERTRKREKQIVFEHEKRHYDRNRNSLSNTVMWQVSKTYAEWNEELLRKEREIQHRKRRNVVKTEEADLTHIHM